MQKSSQVRIGELVVALLSLSFLVLFCFVLFARPFLNPRSLSVLTRHFFLTV
jgi:uncharacterized membrane protein